MPGDSSTPDSRDHRLQRLEEAVGFAQHESEQLAAEVLKLGTRLVEISRRLDTLEQRERASEAALRNPEDPDAGPPNDPPPHSAGPMGRDAR